MKVFLFSWQSRACAVEEKWCGAPPLSPLSSLCSLHFSRAFPLLYLTASWFHLSFIAPCDQMEGEMMSPFSLFSHRDSPLWFHLPPPPSPFLHPIVSSYTPSSSVFSASPVFRASVRLNRAARRKWRGVYFKRKKKKNTRTRRKTRSSLPSCTPWISKCFVRAVGD